MMKELGVNEDIEISCDYARPEIIQELKEAGYWAVNAKKSVKEGIDTVKQFHVYLSDSDENLKKEYDNYMWKKVGDRILDEPVKQWDDAMDSIRYAVMKIKDELASSNSPLISF
jgi:phage terminase large subunit